MVTPLLTTTLDATRSAVAAARARGQRVGFVPTMGALHAGHLSLIRRARAECGFVVVSIFVNPTQFGPHEDLARYPRPFEKDLAACTAEAVDLIFNPTAEVVYPPFFKTFVEVTGLQNVLCGATRPGHFRGVATVVLKLFNIVQPDVAYFGQKDAQQARILIQMVRDLHLSVEMVLCPIVREADGLALSSRNVYLSTEQRQQAPVLFQCLRMIQERIAAGDRLTEPLVQLARARIWETPGARLDYAAIVDFERLEPIDVLSGKVLIALAVFFGATRLIDNILVDVSPA
ncbi:MAG: pantoate--beta-alanine ligase [Planctomycetes bacterium]|nr:pantoate--beta-alanine ligase [Planctomycetota bacterium]